MLLVYIISNMYYLARVTLRQRRTIRTNGERGVYCFSKQSAKEKFMEDAEGNVKKAASFYNDNQ